MKTTILSCLFFCVFLLHAATGQDIVKPKKADADSQKIIVKLQQTPGLPILKMNSLRSIITRQKTSIITNKPENLKDLPENLVQPLFGKIKYSDNQYHFIVSKNAENGKFDKIYVDSNHDLSFKGDKAVSAYYSQFYKDRGYAYANFNEVFINVGKKKVALLVKYIFRNYKGTKREYFNYGVVQHFTGMLKTADKNYKISLIDIKADNIILLGKNWESMLIDINNDGKFDTYYNGDEIIASSTFMLGDMLYKFKLDLENLKIEFSSEKIEKGTIKFDNKNYENPEIRLSRSSSHYGKEIPVKIQNGIGLAPTGSFVIRQFIFTKEKKEYTVKFREYTRKHKIKIEKDKPFTFNLDLLFNIKAYPRVIEGKREIRIMGYIYNKRIVNEKPLLTRCQLLVDRKEIHPTDFNVTNKAGNVVSKGKGYFC